MATLGSILPEVALDITLKNKRVTVLPYTAVSNLDTTDTGITSIHRVAWQSQDRTDQVAVDVEDQASGLCTFYTSGVTTHAGNLIVWSDAN